MDAVKTFFAIAGPLIGLTALIASVYYFRHQKRRNQLRISVSSRAIISSHSPKDLTVNYAGTRLMEPFVVTIRIQNHGPKDIRSDDFDAGTPIRLELGVPPINITDEANERELEFELVNTHIDIKPILLAVNRAHTISLLSSGRPFPQLTMHRVAGADVALGTEATASSSNGAWTRFQRATGAALVTTATVLLAIGVTFWTDATRDDVKRLVPQTTTVTVAPIQTPGPTDQTATPTTVDGA